MNRPSAKHSQSGAALLLALWAMMVLSAAVLVWAAFIQQTLSVSGEQQLDTEARAMAHSGLALALHPMINKETPALKMQEENNPGFRVQMISEGGKLNLNTLLIGESPERIDLFKRWLESRGIEFNDREHMVDCLLDWIDADNVAHLNGAEDSGNYHPPNRGQFFSVDEVQDVEGTEPLTSQPGWKDDLTVDSQGKIDLTSADAHILRLLPGTNDAGIDRFLQWRSGPDQVDGTLDDPPIQKMDQVQAFLGMNKNQWNAIKDLVGLKDPNWRIKVDGWSGNVHRQVEVVASKQGANPRIVDWKE